MDSSEEKEHDLLFGVRRSVRYHNRRCKFFDGLNTLVKAANVLFGSAVVYTMLSRVSNSLSLSIALIITLLSTVDLVVGASVKARLHSDISKKFIELEKKIIISANGKTEEALRKFEAERLDIEANEPPILRVLDTLCHNELLRAMGYDEENFVTIGFFQRIFAHFVDIRADIIKKDGRKNKNLAQ